MEFHRMQRDVQSTRNGFVGHAFRKRCKHFELARNQKCVTIGLAHRAKTNIRRVGRADYQAGGNRSNGGIDLARACMA